MCIRDSQEHESLGYIGSLQAGADGPKGLGNFVEIELSKEVVDDLVAVSYTHLDVYKRQLRLGHGFFAICGGAGAVARWHGVLPQVRPIYDDSPRVRRCVDP